MTPASLNKNNILIIGLLFLLSNIHAQQYRYVNPLFSELVITTGVVYGTADFLDVPYIDESATTNQDLVMDIYQPKGDKLINRPAIVFAHGGGFLTGERNLDDMVALCNYFSRRGYVTVTIDYRLGVEVLDNADLHYTRAAYRGVQDGRSAIRFLRANAAIYGIDPEKIYWGGNSAGSFIGLHMIYMDNDEVPTYARAVNYSVLMSSYAGPDLGNPDIDNHLIYSGKPNGVMSCWGGISDTLFIETDNRTPVFLVHGTNDIIVPFNSGSPFSFNSISPVYGSNSINNRLNNLGIPAVQTYFVEDVGHGFYGVLNGKWINGIGGNAYWDTIVAKAAQFYWQLHKPTAAFTYKTHGLTIDLTNASTETELWIWDYGDGNTSIAQNPSYTFSYPGTYRVKLYTENSSQSWDTLSKEILVTATRIIETETENTISAYPNPSSGLVTLRFDEELKNVSVKVYTANGELILTDYNSQYSRLISLDLSNLQKNMYFIRVSSEKKEYLIKIIKN